MTLPGNALRDNSGMDPFVSPEPREETALTRQADRQADVPALYKTTLERLAVELALGMEEPRDVFTRYEYTEDQALALMEQPHFKALLGRVGTELRENGTSFRAKAKAIAESGLAHAYDIMTDPLQSAAVRADIFKYMCKVAGNEPAPGKGVGDGNSGGFSLSISFSGAAPVTVIDGHQPLTIDQE